MPDPRFPSFQRRSRQDEWMDDYSIDDERLTGALDQLRLVNRHLGGYAATLAAIGPYLKRHGAHRTVTILDVGSGAGDFAEEIVHWAREQTPPLSIHVTATDLNPATVAYARAALERRLPADLRECVDVQVADALALPYDDDSYDLVLAAMFLHHLSADGSVRALREMRRVARGGIVVNDLHRHALAWAGITLLTSILPAAPMVRHDAPLSVLRGFRRAELTRMASAAGFSAFSVRGAWAFRWVLSTISDPPPPPATGGVREHLSDATQLPCVPTVHPRACVVWSKECHSVDAGRGGRVGAHAHARPGIEMPGYTRIKSEADCRGVLHHARGRRRLRSCPQWTMRGQKSTILPRFRPFSLVRPGLSSRVAWHFNAGPCMSVCNITIKAGNDAISISFLPLREAGEGLRQGRVSIGYPMRVETPVPRRWLTLVLGISPWLAAWLGAYVLHSIVASFLLYHVFCLAASLVYRRRFGPREGRSFRRRHWAALAAACLGACLATYALIGVLSSVVAPGRVRAALGALGFVATRTDEIALFIYFAVVNPIVEEFFWRGTIYGGLRRADGSIPGSAWVSALLFGSWHWLIVRLFFPAGLALAATAGIVVVGLLLAAFYERTRSLPAAILLHGLGADVPVLVVLWFAVLRR